MKNNQNPKTIMAILPIALLAVMALSVVPAAHAYGKANWQLGFAGTFIAPGIGNDGFWGWCAFVGVSSGTDGDCQVSQYFHLTHVVSITCETSIDVTDWSIGPSTMLPPGLPGFFINSGHITVNPSSATAACLAAFPGVVSSSGDIIAPFDTGLPAIPGHYNFNSFVGHPGELQIQVTQIQ